MAATSSIRIDKQFTYRTVLTTFSNRYHFGTYTVPDSTHWTTLADAITAAEKAIYCSLANGGAKIIRAVGYDPGSEIPVFTKTYSLDGTCATTTFGEFQGDSAAVVRYSTPDRSTKNHPIYCYNYYHAFGSGGSQALRDNVGTNQLTALTTYATAWLTGFSDGTTTVHRSRPTGNLCTGVFVNPLLTHRDIPR